MKNNRYETGYFIGMFIGLLFVILAMILSKMQSGIWTIQIQDMITLVIGLVIYTMSHAFGRLMITYMVDKPQEANIWRSVFTFFTGAGLSILSGIFLGGIILYRSFPL